MDFKNIGKEAEKDLEKANDLKVLNEIFRKYLGKKGEITRIFSSLKKISAGERKNMGKQANLLKVKIEKAIKEKAEEIKKIAKLEKVKKERIDITRPGYKLEIGHLNPLTLVQREIGEIFQSMGFSIIEGPEIETEWYNFDALNIPKDHPARDVWDTFWIRQDDFKSKEKFLLRTHTSPMQAHYMEKHHPPFKIIVPGKCFRHEATDASHEIQFYQLEGLVVDKNISAANFRAIIEEFLRKFFKTDIEIRLKPDYFPFTEPSFEVSVRRKKGDWMELMGAGMVHPNVFKAVGYTQSPSESGWQGFAFGVGIDRLAMVKYKIDDIRLFNSGDLRFLNQF